MLTPPDTWSCPIWDLHLFLCWDHSFLNLSCLRTFLVSNIHRYFYFAPNESKVSDKNNTTQALMFPNVSQYYGIEQYHKKLRCFLTCPSILIKTIPHKLGGFLMSHRILTKTIPHNGNHIIPHGCWSMSPSVTQTDRPKSVCNRCLIGVFLALFVLSLCPFDISVGVGAFVIGLGQISSFLPQNIK